MNQKKYVSPSGEKGNIAGADDFLPLTCFDGDLIFSDEIAPRRDEFPDIVSLEQFCEELSISTATGRNWVRLGKIMPVPSHRKGIFFTRETVNELKRDLRSSEKKVLKKRRNKKFIEGNDIYACYVPDHSPNINGIQAIVHYLKERREGISDSLIQMLLADCSVKLFHCRDASQPSSLREYWNRKPQVKYSFLIDDLLSGCPELDETVKANPELFQISYELTAKEDTLGFIYLSLKSLGSRKAEGAYYTPSSVVDQLCTAVFSGRDLRNEKILDPCCGTGNFILQLPETISPLNIYGNDIDPVSIKIARINYVLKYGIYDADIVYSHIADRDFLLSGSHEKFDIILGNPPWGCEFTREQKERLRKQFRSAAGRNIESYDVFIEQAVRKLYPGGILSYVLPEAILTVKNHAEIRKFLLENVTFEYLEYLGNAFGKVQCPSVILQMRLAAADQPFQGMRIRNRREEFTINGKRAANPECFDCLMKDEEYSILDRIYAQKEYVTLAGNADFALGIVTGDNGRYLMADSSLPGAETVLKGSDIYKYKITNGRSYIVFRPENFQQVAPSEIYRAREKLLYRFICKHLVFAYDNRQMLSLNSCNIVIPRLPDLSIKYIMTILNSRTAQFIFQKKFNSLKILRAHIESIPIPCASGEIQMELEKRADALSRTTDMTESRRLFSEIDEIIARLFHLNEREYRLILAETDEANQFLK